MQEIYAYHVRHGLASFEEEPPSVEEMRRRYEDVCSRGLPWLAADFGGVLAGYGYCALYRARSAYPGPVFNRLRQIKRRIDPSNVFDSNVNIPPGA